MKVFNDLKYAQEHLACDCYMSKEDSVWGNITAGPGEYVIREPLKRNVLVFIMSGAMEHFGIPPSELRMLYKR